MVCHYCGNVTHFVATCAFKIFISARFLTEPRVGGWAQLSLKFEFESSVDENNEDVLTNNDVYGTSDNTGGSTAACCVSLCRSCPSKSQNAALALARAELAARQAHIQGLERQHEEAVAEQLRLKLLEEETSSQIYRGQQVGPRGPQRGSRPVPPPPAH